MYSQDIIDLMNDNTGLKTEVERLKTDLRLVNAELSGFKLAVEHREQELRDLTDDVERLKESLSRFKHYHVSGRDRDVCASCGLDLRNEVHIREALKEDK